MRGKCIHPLVYAEPSRDTLAIRSGEAGLSASSTDSQTTQRHTYTHRRTHTHIDTDVNAKRLCLDDQQ